MKKLFLFYLVFMMFFASQNRATTNIIKGSLGAKANKFYNMTSFKDGTMTVSVMFDNAQSNVNVGVGQGSTLIAASVSTQKNFEQLQMGTISDNRFTILLQNYSGPATPYRMIVNGGEAEDILSGAEINRADLVKLASQMKRVTGQVYSSALKQ